MADPKVSLPVVLWNAQSIAQVVGVMKFATTG